MSTDEHEAFRRAAERELDEMEPDVPEVVIAMIDALRAYVAMLTSIADGSYTDDAPLPADNAAWDDIARCKVMLADLENNWGLDPTLGGLIK